MTTLCIDCDHVHTSTRNQPPYRWACLKHPVWTEAPYPDLDPNWRPDPPYGLCRHVRCLEPGADCDDFSPRRGQTVDGINA